MAKFGFVDCGCKIEVYSKDEIDGKHFLKKVELTQAEYDALTEYDVDTLYIITDATNEIELYDDSYGEYAITISKSDYDKCAYFYVKGYGYDGTHLIGSNSTNKDIQMFISKEQLESRLSFVCSWDLTYFFNDTYYTDKSVAHGNFSLTKTTVDDNLTLTSGVLRAVETKYNGYSTNYEESHYGFTDNAMKFRFKKLVGYRGGV